jgi:hypothetical protein
VGGQVKELEAKHNEAHDEAQRKLEGLRQELRINEKQLIEVSPSLPVDLLCPTCISNVKLAVTRPAVVPSLDLLGLPC